MARGWQMRQTTTSLRSCEAGTVLHHAADALCHEANMRQTCETVRQTCETRTFIDDTRQHVRASIKIEAML